MAVSTTPAGWYPDNNMPATLRYWDGSAWTSHVAPMKQETPAPPVAGGMTVGNAVILALVVPVVGVVLGCVELARGRGSRGALLLLVSAAAAIVYMSVVSFA